jgi:hypothetical protein
LWSYFLSEKTVNELRETFAKLTKNCETYFKFSEMAEREEETLQRTISYQERGLSKQEDVDKVAKRRTKNKQESEEALHLYKVSASAMEKCLNQLGANFEGHFKEFDKNEIARIAFMKSLIKKFFGLAGGLYTANKDAEEFQRFDEKVKELSDIFSMAPKPAIAAIAGNQSIDFLHKEHKTEIIRYEDFKRSLQILNRKVESISDGKEFQITQMEFIDQVVNLFHRSVTHSSNQFTIPPSMLSRDFNEVFVNANLRAYFFDTLDLSMKKLSYYVQRKEEVFEVMRRCVIAILYSKPLKIYLRRFACYFEG